MNICRSQSSVDAKLIRLSQRTYRQGYRSSPERLVININETKIYTNAFEGHSHQVDSSNDRFRRMIKNIVY